MRSRTVLVTSMLACVGAAMVAACAGGNGPNGAELCKTQITGYSSPAPGVLTLKGQFFADESVILQTGATYPITPVQVFGTATPASDRTALSFTNMPSGIHSYNIIISCASGREDRGDLATSVG
jgi:hypothetical protein